MTCKKCIYTKLKATCDQTSGRSKVYTTPGPISFIIMQILANIVQKIGWYSFLLGWHIPSGKSLIRHCEPLMIKIFVRNGIRTHEPFRDQILGLTALTACIP